MKAIALAGWRPLAELSLRPMPRLRQSDVTWPRRISKFAACIGAALLWFTLLSPIDIGGPVGIVWVSGTSMEPGLHTGDLVVTYERSHYDVGDIVAFEIPQGGVIIHRVIEVTADDKYIFQGDNRNYADPWELPAEAVLGKHVVDIPKAATAAVFLTQPLSMAVMVTIIAGLLLAPTKSDEDYQSNKQET